MNHKNMVFGVLAICCTWILGFQAAAPAAVQKTADSASAVRSVVFDVEDGEVYVNGNKSNEDVPMTMNNGRVYVAAYLIADVFDFTMQWDPKSYDSILQNETTKLNVNQQAKRAWVNDLPVNFDGVGFVEDGRLLLSIRAIADYMGLYVRYDALTRQAVVADPEYPYVHPVNTAQPNLIPVDFSRYAHIPVAAVTERRDTSRALIFSDSPETFRDYGVLYRDALEGKVRIFLTHVNGMNTAAVVGVIATNTADKPITVSVARQGTASRSKDYAGQGRDVLAQWHADGETAQETVVEPRQSIALYRSPVLENADGAHAIFDIETDGKIQYDIVALRSSDPMAVEASTPLLDTDIHDRGTFPVSDIDVRVDASQWKTGDPVRIPIGRSGSLNDHWTQGIDAVTGKKSQNFGNYGVFYHLTAERPGKAAYVLVPLRGIYQGTVNFNGNVVQTAAMDVGESFLIGRTGGEDASVRIDLGASSGSYMPFEILVVPLP